MGPGTYPATPIEHRFARDGGLVGIGRWTSIGGRLCIYCGGYHHTDWVTTSPILDQQYGEATYSRGDVEIGSDVWIGDDVTIMSGVTIGHGAVVGAWSVVDRDVPPYAIVAGNRAVFRRWRFGQGEHGEMIRSALLAIAWWDWPEARVRERQLDLCQPDIEAFIRKYGGE